MAIIIGSVRRMSEFERIRNLSRHPNRSLPDIVKRRRNEILLLGIALGARIITTLLQLIYGIHSIVWLPGAISISDFFTLNGGELHALSLGLLPYRDFAFSYPPLFLYILYPFYIIGGLEGAVIPILASDAASTVVIYLIAKRATSTRIAFVAAMAYALSPFVLYEEGYLFLSSQPMAFFMLLSLYFLASERPIVASFLLAVAIMIKQEALFVLPVYLAWYVAKYKVNAWKGISIFVGAIFLVSLPFLLVAPKIYLMEVSYGIIQFHAGSSFLVVPSSFDTATSLNTFSQTCSSSVTVTPLISQFVACGVTYSRGVPTILDSLGTLVALMNWAANFVRVPLFLMVFPIIYLSRKRTNIISLCYAYSLVGFLILFSFIIHGLFSYYFLPIYALLFASARGRRSVIIVVVLSAVTILVPDVTILPVLVTLIGITCILATGDGQPVPSNDTGVHQLGRIEYGLRN